MAKITTASIPIAMAIYDEQFIDKGLHLVVEYIKKNNAKTRKKKK